MTQVTVQDATPTLPANRGYRLTWCLHVLVASVAVLSVLTNRFDMWVDLRMLGWAGMIFAWVWALSALAAGWLAGPVIRGWGSAHARWVWTGASRRWARLLLGPSVLMVAILLVNTAYYFWLLYKSRTDFIVPLPPLAAAFLGAWTHLSWRRTKHMPQTAGARMSVSFWGQLGAAATAGLTVALVAGFTLLHVYERPPAQKVDLAVVLGTWMYADGKASNELAFRVRAATDLYRRGQVKHILLSGGNEPGSRAHPEERNELEAMLAVCLAEGVPRDAITLDPVGLNTKATAYNTREFMRAHGYQTVVACSTDYHLFRTHLSFAWVGLDAYTVASQPVVWRCADPRATLREMIGVVVYVLNPHYREAKGAVMQLKMPRVVVRKTAGVLELYDGRQPVKNYSCITGGNAGDKSVEGDRRTPVGVFHIVYKNPLSKFHLSLGLDYPRREDAQRGLDAKLITREQYDGIVEALNSDLSQEANQQKLWHTPLGGEIFIHGHANGRNGTAGCIALSNDDVDELYAILPLGTEVEILP